MTQESLNSCVIFSLRFRLNDFYNKNKLGGGNANLHAVKNAAQVNSKESDNLTTYGFG